FAGEKEPKALFPGSDDVNQLEKIFEWCGTPSTEEWAEVENLAHWNALKPKESKKRRLLERFANLKSCSKKVLDLLDKLLVLNPAKRLTTNECLNHDWFWEKGSTTNIKLKNLPSTATNEFLTRKKGDNKPNAPSHQLPGSTSVQQLPHNINQSYGVSSTSSSHPPFGSSNGNRHSYNPSHHHQSSHHSSHHSNTSSSHHNGSSHHNSHHHHQSSHHHSSSSHHGSTGSGHSNNYHRDNRHHHDPPQRNNQLAPPNKKVKY
ncbi:cell cycle dependent kinase C, partial [Naegleria gruberi]